MKYFKSCLSLYLYLRRSNLTIVVGTGYDEKHTTETYLKVIKLNSKHITTTLIALKELRSVIMIILLQAGCKQRGRRCSK